VIDEKGVFELIQVFQSIVKRNQNVHLVVVGSGEIVKAIEKQKSAWGKITFMGQQSKDIVYKLYQIADIGVIPSKFEQCSYTALEMMSHGLPIIASDTPGLNELFIHNNSALLFKMKKCDAGRTSLEIDIKDFQKQIESLIVNTKLRNILKMNAKEKWIQNYMAENMTIKTIFVYEKVLSKT
jgi:glycosyltransferase involved in cell wall biosynthesis